MSALVGSPRIVRKVLAFSICMSTSNTQV
jgi:hypothetical protein